MPDQEASGAEATPDHAAVAQGYEPVTGLAGVAHGLLTDHAATLPADWNSQYKTIREGVGNLAVMATYRRGRFGDVGKAPATGELVQELATVDGVRIEYIVSGTLDAAVDYEQDHDEWFVLLSGAAEISVRSQQLTLGAGEWLLLPRHTPHSLASTMPGSTWLAVHLPIPRDEIMGLNGS